MLTLGKGSQSPLPFVIVLIKKDWKCIKFIINTFNLHPSYIKHVFSTICHTYFVPEAKYYHHTRLQQSECFYETLELVSSLPLDVAALSP